jgi:histidinol-phosphatase (PHP family)
LKWDGHTHSPYCPHGSKDSLESYIEKAIMEGFQRYSITEHAPLPPSFIDPAPQMDSAMKAEDIDAYISECEQLKERYKKDIDIKIGLEIDFLLGYEDETREFLNKVGPRLDDAILSVHFLPIHNKWVCLDYSPEVFEEDLLGALGSVDEVYKYYYQIVYQSVTADLGPYKPKRMGHLSVIEKFKKKYPSKQREIWWNQVIMVLEEIRERQYTLDFNTAGLLKPLCEDVYPSSEIFHAAHNLGIPFVYGSDSHQAKTVGHNYDEFIKSYLKSTV